MNNIQEIKVTRSYPTTQEINDLIINCMQDVKGKSIVKLDLRSIDDAPTNFFIICQGESVTQVKAISDNIERRLRTEMGVKPNHVEGNYGAKWVLVDYFDTVVHVFHPEAREYYDLEELWSDANSEEYEDF